MQVCETILARKAAQATSCKVNGVQFGSLLYPDAANNGWCQRTARLVYQAATGRYPQSTWEVTHEQAAA